ncbi:uncharacterized protein LOC110981530 isoform X2 [Acanthaster planci]|uniref:Uncharacterized protein LOC110981530 isoform X2 n=1 Tax=Acanthaster planci TaxID=133434 RepID=A0A8B7YU16_ACAPL|nr:uncharacterized protein LOC110981530 isoform X2 [Acanthaster planci]XP_022094838.1 uncharacterized protein LOC110981530 isoform X2 [Acanthaster planci]
MTRLKFLSVMLAVLAFCRVCWPCSVIDWKPMTVAEQAAKAKIIVYGTVEVHHKMPDVPLDRAYIAEMNVTCNLKGDVQPPRINISEAGELTSCHHTLLPVDGTYITFLERNEDGNLVPDEVNYLSVAFPPTKENVQGVAEAVGNLKDKCPQIAHLGNGSKGVSVSVMFILSLTMAAIIL